MAMVIGAHVHQLAARRRRLEGCAEKGRCGGCVEQHDRRWPDGCELGTNHSRHALGGATSGGASSEGMSCECRTCDDQEMVRDGLRVMLKSASDIAAVAMAGDGAEAIRLCVKHQPDVVLMDLEMPHMNGIHATRQIREQAPSVRVLVLTTYDADEWVCHSCRSCRLFAQGLTRERPRES